MKKRFFTTTLLLSVALAYTFSQECNLYIPDKIGSVLEFTSYDKKGKESGFTSNTVKNIETIPEGKKITMESAMKQKKGDEPMVNEYIMYCKNGRFILDMKQFIPQDQNTQNANGKVEASEMDYPASMSVGQSLKDGHITITMTAEGMPMPMVTTVDIINRKVTGQEEITTPAGSFKCFKIEYNIAMKMMFKISMKATEWVAVGVGNVKTETYDNNGKLTASTLLTKIVN